VNVLVDTSVWSLALRRAKRIDAHVQRELTELIDESRALIIGPIRQELLSGIKERTQFDKSRQRLHALPDLQLASADYEQAAEFFDNCRERGIQGSNTDLLICAVATRHDLAILTTDDDFRQYARVLPLELHKARR
jgi:predicted nucleic acid-binding protein